MNVHVDGEFALSVPLEVVLRRGLRTGTEIDDAGLATLARDDQRWRAKQSALNLLSYRQRSETELRRQLLRRRFLPDVVEECVVDLRNAGLLNDDLFAATFARDRRRRRPIGRARLEAELSAKGVEAETIARVLAQLDEEEGETEIDLARHALRKFPTRAGEDPMRRRRRLAGFLGRRGFGAEVIAEVIADE